MTRILVMLVLCVFIPKNSKKLCLKEDPIHNQHGENINPQQSPENVISKTDFEKTLLKTADGIYGMLNSDKSRSLVIDELTKLLDSATNNVLKRYGHNPPVESAVLRRVLENLTYLVADASTLNHLHQNEEKSISFKPVPVQSVLQSSLPNPDELKQKQINNMMANLGKPDPLTPINSKVSHLGFPVAVKNISDAQPLLVLNSKYMPLGETEKLNPPKAENKPTSVASDIKSPKLSQFQPQLLQSNAKIFDDKILSPWDSPELKSSKVGEPPTMTETDALKLTPRILFIDSNGTEFQLVGAGGETEAANCPPSQCLLIDDNSKEVLAFQRPLSLEYLVLRGANGEQLYTSGVQLCQDSDVPPSRKSYEPANLSNLLPHLRRRNNKKSALSRNLAAKWEGNNVRDAMEDEDVANLFKWHDRTVATGEASKSNSEFSPLTPHQAFKALSKQRRDLRTLRRRFPNRRRQLRHHEIADESIKGYEQLEEDNNKRVKRSTLTDNGEIFDLMPELKSDKDKIGHSNKIVAEDSADLAAPQDLIDLDRRIDQIEQNTSSTTTAAAPQARAVDEEINMVQPNTPYAIEEELVLKNATEKRRTDLPTSPVVGSVTSTESGEPEYYDESGSTETDQPNGLSYEIKEEFYVDKSQDHLTSAENDGLQQPIMLIQDLLLQDNEEEDLSTAEIVERVNDDVLFKVRSSNVMGQVLGDAVKPAPVIYNPMEETHHKEYENVMRNLLLKVLMDVEHLAQEDLQDQNCLTLEQPLQDFLMELLGLPAKNSIIDGYTSNIAMTKRSVNAWL